MNRNIILTVKCNNQVEMPLLFLIMLYAECKRNKLQGTDERDVPHYSRLIVLDS